MRRRSAFSTTASVDWAGASVMPEIRTTGVDGLPITRAVAEPIPGMDSNSAAALRAAEVRSTLACSSSKVAVREG